MLADVKTGNLFLDNLTPSVLDLLRPTLVRVHSQHGDPVFERNEPMARIFFPISCLISVVLELSDGDVAEVGIIGREGMSGIEIAFGNDRSSLRALIQVPDGSQCMQVADFRKALEQIPHFKAYALRYANATMIISAHMSACNTLHSTNERCARWFLMAHDRVEGDSYFLTHEFLSQMLGVRRASVTLAALALQEAGFISYTRGQVSIRDRAGLESVSCECYFSIEQDFKALMGYSGSKTL